MCVIPRTERSQRFQRSGVAKKRQPTTEVALHAVLVRHRAVRILPLRIVRSRADVPVEKVPGGIGVDDARDIRRVDDLGTLLPHDREGIIHRLALIGSEAASRDR